MLDSHETCRALLPPSELAEGRIAGRSWARGELRRGYFHPIAKSPEHSGRWRILITDLRARRLFDGLCFGKSPTYLRGFVGGASEIYAESIGRQALPEEGGTYEHA